VAGGLVDILHAGVVVATHAQRIRDDQAARLPRAPVARRARDTTAGLTVTRLADGAGVVSFVGTPYACGRRWARTAIDVSIVAASVYSHASSRMAGSRGADSPHQLQDYRAEPSAARSRGQVAAM